MLNSHQILYYYVSSILILQYQSSSPYICIYIYLLLVFFVDSYESLFVTLVFLNDYSIIQIKLSFSGPAFLSKVSHCISLLPFYVYCPLLMSPCLINTVIINTGYQFCLSFYATTPAWMCSLKIFFSHDVELNPDDFTNGFFKDNFHRVQLHDAYDSICNYDLISVCETSLNDSVELPDPLLNKYTFVSSNSPNNNRHCVQKLSSLRS